MVVLVSAFYTEKNSDISINEIESVGYIMKLSPLSVIEQTIQKAINKVKLKHILLRNKFYEEYWSDNHCIITEQFWKDILQKNAVFGRNPGSLYLVVWKLFLKK